MGNIRGTELKVGVSILLLIPGLFVGCHGNAGSGSGEPSILEPVPVMVVQVDVSLILSSLNISWIDEINMNDVSYIVSYNITVGTVSLSADLAVLGGNDTSLNVTDLAVVRGVTVNVTIIVNNTLGLLSEERTFDVAVEGEFAPPVMDLALSPLTSGDVPGVILSWNNTFDIFPPVGFDVVTSSMGSNETECPSAGAVMAVAGTSDYQLELGGLLYFTNYSFSVIAMYSVAGATTKSDEVTVSHTTEEGSPDAVANLTMTFDDLMQSFNPDSQLLNITVTISWDTPPNPNGNLRDYSVEFSQAGATSDVQSLIVLPTATSAVLSFLSLSPFTLYEANVTASTGGGSSLATITGQSPEAEPSPVQNVELSLDAATAVYDSANNTFSIVATVTWDVPENRNGILTSHAIDIFLLEGSAPFYSTTVSSSSTTNGSATNFALTVDVIPYRLYRAVVTVSNSAGSSAANSSDELSPQAAPDEVTSIVLRFEAESGEFNSTSQLLFLPVNVTWTPPSRLNGILTNYSVTFRGSLGNDVIFVGPESTARASVYVRPFEFYNVSVVAETGGGTSQAVSDSVQSPVAVSSPPRNVNVSNVTSQMAVIRWEEPRYPNGDILSYNVTVTSSDGTQIQRGGVTGLYVSVDLVPFTNYSAVVQAVHALDGELSVPVSFSTLEGLPGQVENVSLIHNDSHFLILWAEPVPSNGLVSYLLNLSCTDLYHGSSSSVFINKRTTELELIIMQTVLPYTRCLATVLPLTGAGHGTGESSVIMTAEEVPSGVSMVTASDTGGSVLLSWTQPTSPNGDLQYNVTLEVTDLFRGSIHSYLTFPRIPGMIVTLNTSVDVQPYFNYTATVLPFTNPGPGPSATGFLATAQQAPEGSIFVNDFSFINSSHIFANWTEPPLPNGRLRYAINLTSTDVFRATSNLLLSQEVVDLSVLLPVERLAYTQYNLSVLASTDVGSGEVATGSFQTQQEVPGGAIAIAMPTFIGNSSLFVNWTEPSSPNGNLRYRVNLTTRDLFTTIVSSLMSEVVVNTEFTFSVIMRLHTEYSVTVVALTNAGDGSSATRTFQTSQGVPEGDLELDAVFLNSSHLFVNWTEPNSPNGELRYQVNVTSTNILLNSELFLLSQDITGSPLPTSVLLPVEEMFYTRYLVSVEAFTDVGGGGRATLELTTPQGAPSAPVQLSVVSLSSTAISVSWATSSSPNGIISHYIVTSFPTLSGRGNASTFNASALQFNISDLTPFTNYTIFVAAVTVDVGNESDLATVVTDEAAPSHPLNLVVSLNRSALTVTWDTPLTPNGELSYLINISSLDVATGNPAQVEMSLSRSDDGNRQVVLDITFEAFVRYTVRLQARTGGGVSGVVTGNVTSDEAVSLPPENLMTDATNVSITVMWDVPSDSNGIVSGYRVAILLGSELSAKNVTETTFATEFVGLNPFTNYSISVRAYTDGGRILGDVAMVNATTDIGVPTAPRNVTASPEGVAESITVSWLPPAETNSPSLFYMVNYRELGGLSRSTSTAEDRLEVVIVELLPFTNYTVTVQACSSVDCGSISMEVSTVTLQGAPSSPVNFSLSTVPGNSAVLEARWEEPEVPNGILRNYTVVCNGTLEFQAETSSNDGSGVVQTSLTDLTAFTVYECIVYATTDGGRGNSSDPSVAMTAEDAPSSPLEFLLGRVDNSFSTLSSSWQPPSMPNGNLLGYNITCTLPESGGMVDFAVPSDKTSFLLTGLLPFTRYSCNISGRTAAGTGSPSNASEARTDEGIADRPGNLNAVGVASRSVLLDWEEPDVNGVLQEYRVAVFFGSMTISMDTIASNITTFNVSRLQPFTEYMFEVVAVNGAGVGGKAVLNITTDQDAPTAPVDVSLDVLSFSSINISWQPPTTRNGILCSYTITVFPTEHGQSNANPSEVVNGSVTSFLATGLEPFTNYSVVVAAVTVAMGPFSEVATRVTFQDAPSAPVQLSVVSLSSTAVSVSWATPSSPNGIINHYIVTSFPTRSGRGNSSTFNTSALQFNITGLTPFTNYTVSVAAVTVAVGDESDVATVVTDEDAPSDPLNLVVSLNCSALTVTWDTPLMPNGVLSYLISISSLDLATGNPAQVETSLSRSDDGNRQVVLDITFEAFVMYTVRLQARTGGGVSGVVTESVTSDEAAPSAPQNFSVSTFTGSPQSLSASWYPPTSLNGDLTSYNVSCNSEASPGEMTMFAVTPPTRSTTLTDLLPFTNYSCRVTASTGAGEGPASNSDVAETDESTPGPVQISETTVINSTSIQVRWTAPTEPNGRILHYNVSIFQIFPSNELLSSQLVEESNLAPYTAVFTNLTPFTSFIVSIFAVTRIGPGVEQRREVVTDPDSASPPSSFTAMVLNSTAVALSWGYPEIPRGVIEGYIVTVTGSEPFNLTLVSPGDNRTQSFTLGNLLPFTTYDFAVLAYSFGSDPFFVHRGEEGKVTRTTSEAVPTAPRNFTLETSPTPTILLASWVVPLRANGILSNYSIVCNDSKAFSVDAPSGNQTVIQTGLTGLTAFTFYECSVMASTGAGAGQSSETVVAMTAEDVPSAPLNFDLRQSTSSSLLASWDVPATRNGIIQGYTVSCNATPMATPITFDAPSDTLVLNLTSLLPFTNYTCSVTANTSAGAGLASNLDLERTDEGVPSAPLNFDLRQSTSSSLLASWDVPATRNGIIQGYTVSCNATPMATPITVDAPSDTLVLNLTSLLPFTNYTCSVTANTSAGAGLASNLDLERTDEGVPGPVSAIVVTDLNSSSIWVSWAPPLEPNGILLRYIVTLAPSDGQPPANITAEIGRDSYTLEFHSLRAFTGYMVTVTAATVVGEGEGTSRTVTTDPFRASAPTMVSVNQVEASSFRITWGYPNIPQGEIGGYVVEITNAETSDVVNITNITLSVLNDDRTQMITVSELQPFTLYSYSIRAFSYDFDNFILHRGDEFTAMQRTGEASPPAPANFALSPVNGNSSVLAASWSAPDPPNGVLLSYILSCSDNVTRIFPHPAMAAEVSVVVTELRADTEYNCSVVGRTNGGTGSASNPDTEKTVEDVPSAPLNLELLSDTFSSLWARWEIPATPNGVILSYTISCQTTPMVTPMPMVTPTTLQFITSNNEPSFNLTNLSPFTYYTCSAVANTSAGAGPSSNSATERTNETVPSEPRSLMTLNISSTSIALSWTSPTQENGVIRGYQVTVLQEDAPFNSSIVDSTTFEARDLRPFTNYTFSVGGVTGAGVGSEASITVVTLEDVPSGAPLNLTISERTSTSLRLVWTPPNNVERNGVLQNYTVSYSSTSGGGAKTQTTPNTEVLLEGLEEFTNYSIIVNASTSVGIGPGAMLITSTRSATPGMVVITSFNATSDMSLMLQWEEPPLVDHNGIIEGYRIILEAVEGEGEAPEAKNVNRSTRSYSFTGLLPFTKYMVWLSAVNMNGAGVNSTDTARTLEGVPGAVMGLNFNLQTYSRVFVYWTPPSSPNGNILNYSVTHYELPNTMVASTLLSSLNVTLENLSGSTEYRVAVAAITIAGTGEEVTIDFKTDGGPPVVVPMDEFKDVVPVVSDASAITPTSIPISFRILPEQEVNGEITRYLIVLGFSGSSNPEVTTYYEAVVNFIVPGNRPKYRALEKAVSDSQPGRKRQEGGGATQSVTLGSDRMCTIEDDICNGPLLPDTAYNVQYTLFTADNQSATYNFSNPLKTSPQPATSNIGIVVGVILGVVIVALGVVLVIVLGYYLYRRLPGSHDSYSPSKRKKNALSLLIAENQAPLEPTEHTIVPLHEMSEGNQKYQLHHAKPHSRKIYLREYEKHLRYMLDDSMYRFSEEYERISEIGLDHSKEASLQADNRAKNRYTNILAYDHSRVKLSFVDDDPGSDYINGCYIPGYRMRRAYIATQGPLPATCDDFWRMVWEQNTHIIVMLTQLVERGRTKCHRYWPGIDPMVYGEIEVEMQSEKEKNDWMIREFKLSISEKRYRIVRHFQFTSWPDHGVPDSPVAAVDFVKNIRCYVDPIQHGPIVVHCSAGVGRTGCFIALDTLIQHMNDHDWVDIFGTACEMRQHRNHLIQTEAQYVFIHKALLEVMDVMSTMKNGTTGSHYSQGGGYTPVFINRFTEPNDSQMTDYFNELSITEETHV